MSTLFISDLHLSEERPDITALFLKFLDADASQAEALYILGDFFEYWVGDDALMQTEFQPIIKGLRALRTRDVPIYIMHGNRDFLIGAKFATETGCQLLADPTVVNLYGQPTLLMHGDLLCTDDIEYQRFRIHIRQPQSIDVFLRKSLTERDAMVRGYRQMSKAATSLKDLKIMDANTDAVIETMTKHGVQRLIHGHTHRPGKHVLTVQGHDAQRIVLGDWYEHGSVLRCDAKDCVLQSL